MTTGTKRSKDERLLISAAETIGSTLGALAAKAESAAKALGGRKLIQKAENITKAINGGKVSRRLGLKRKASRKSRVTGTRGGRGKARRVNRSSRAASKRRS